MKKFIKNVALASLLAFPYIASAQIPGYPDTPGSGGSGGGGSIEGLIDRFGDIIKSLIPITVGLALVVFFWGLVKFIAAADSEDAKKQAKSVMIWGLIALFVMISVWGLVRFIQDALIPGADFSPPPVIFN